MNFENEGSLSAGYRRGRVGDQLVVIGEEVVVGGGIEDSIDPCQGCSAAVGVDDSEVVDTGR